MQERFAQNAEKLCKSLGKKLTLTGSLNRGSYARIAKSLAMLHTITFFALTK
jgi:hypothetical protein